MSSELILYDLPSRHGYGWSGNTLKTRFAMNYKKIPYRTEWVPFARVQDTIKATGVPPNGAGAMREYTVPTVQLPDGSYVMDSAKIAPKLEALKAQPSLHLGLDGLDEKASAIVLEIIMPLLAWFMPKLPRKMTIMDDVDWFHADRSQRFGMPLDELEAQKGGDSAWEAARPGLLKAGELLRNHKRDQGPFILGSELSYGDIVIVALIHMLKLIGEGGYEKAVAVTKELDDLYKGSEAKGLMSKLD